MDALDLLVVADVVIVVMTTAPVWVPGLLCLAVVVTWWRLRPTGRHRHGRTFSRTPGRTAVRTRVRTFTDTWPDTASMTALTCTDMCPDVSACICPGVSGHEEEGER